MLTQEQIFERIHNDPILSEMEMVADSQIQIFIPTRESLTSDRFALLNLAGFLYCDCEVIRKGMVVRFWIVDDEKHETVQQLIKTLQEIRSKNKPAQQEQTAEQFVESLDFSPLTNKIKDVLGVGSIDLEYTAPADLRNSGNSLHITSSNLIGCAGVFKHLLEEVGVTSSNSVISKDENGNWRIWVVVDLKYGSSDGGRNGLEMFTAWFNAEDSGKWEFRDTYGKIS